jgi:hypothetical protein
LIEIDELCRKNNTKLVVVEVWGLCGLILSDFGSSYTYLNSTGKEYIDSPVDCTFGDSVDVENMVRVMFLIFAMLYITS